MSKTLKSMTAGMMVAFLLGVSPAYAFLGRAVRRTVMAVKTGTGVADKTTEDELNNKINSKLEYLKESHRLDRTARQEKP